MGMYTEICLNVRLEENTPSEVINLLSRMVNGPWLRNERGYVEIPVPDHPFFQCPRWRMVLTCSSHYFVPFSHSTMRFDEIADTWFLCARADLKNYDSEIEQFFNWLQPYIDAPVGEFIGYSRYEESNVPTLYFKEASQ